MAKANLVEKKIQMSVRDIVKYQLLSHCFVHDISHSDAELECLTLLGIFGECDLADFCNAAVDESIFKVSQTVRNFLTKAEKFNLIEKNGKTRKKIKLTNSLNVQTRGNIILDYKIFHIEAKES
tara:strand:- start:117 stop:488 length:372 start_codon:yes stop_codon:yes gene_type:complete